MLRGSSPIRLQQLDISPALEAGALEQQAAVNLASSIQQAALNFAQKQEEKKQKEIGIRAIQNLLGTDEVTSKALYSDPIVQDAYKQAQDVQMQKRRLAIQEQQQEIVQQEADILQADREALIKAIGVNTTPEGTIDTSGLLSAYTEFGGQNIEEINKFIEDTKGPEPIVVDERGIITQGGIFKGQVPSSTLPPKPLTEQEQELFDLDIESKKARLEKAKLEVEQLQKELEGGGDSGDLNPDIIEFMKKNPDKFKTYEEAEQHLKDKGVI